MRWLASLTLLVALSSCGVNVPRPVTEISLPPTAAGNGFSAPIAPQSGAGQQFVNAAVAREWWTMFGSSRLNELVGQALRANNDIATAESALQQARELALVAGAARLPAADLGYNVLRTQATNALAPPLTDANISRYTLHTSQITVSYPIDVFGGVHNKIASARAAASVQRYKFEAARTTVISNLVLAVIQNASLGAQINAAKANISASQKVLEMLRMRQRLGAVGTLDVATQETTVATAEAMLPPLIRAQVHQQALIAALLGVAPGNPLPALPTLDAIVLPADLPLTLPAELVAHRPDVRAARAQMEGASADVGTAIAARLPAFQISGSLGGASGNFAEMFASGNPFWTILGSVAQPLFHGGALRHQQRATEAALESAKAQYRAAALQAFVDVSDALTALHADADLLDANARAESAASRTMRYVTRQLQLGDVGTFALLNAQAANAQAESALLQARTARLNDCVALIQALGGGWDAIN